MIRLFLSTFLLLISLFGYSQECTIVFGLADINPTLTRPYNPRSPIVFPQATLDDHTLYITRSVGAELLEVRQNDVAVFQTLISTDNPIIILPDTITGDCELILYCPVFTFVAQVEC